MIANTSIPQTIERYCHSCHKRNIFTHSDKHDIKTYNGNIQLAAYRCDNCKLVIYPELINK